MTKTLLETLSVKQLTLFCILIFFAVTGFFVLGGIKGADPASANIHIANLFVTNKPGGHKYSFHSPLDWVWYRVTGRDRNDEVNAQQGYEERDFVHILHSEDKNLSSVTPENLVMATKLPHPGAGRRMYREFQFMLVVMSVQMNFLKDNIEPDYNPKQQIECILDFSAKLGYSDEENGTEIREWKELTRVENQKRPLKCVFSRLEQTKHGDHYDGYYTCEDQHFFELGSVAHKHYLVNIVFNNTPSNMHCLASQEHFFNGVHFTEIHQNGGYTLSLFVAKTVVFPFILAAFLFFYMRVKRENREFLLLEKCIIGLNGALLFLLLPIDWLTLAMDMPFMLVISDVRQGLFYTALLVFWSVFAGEHILDQVKRNNITSYKLELGCITIGCSSMLIFDIVERGIQLANPFHTIWKKDAGETAARIFIGCAGVASVLYALFFIRLLWKVQRNMSLMRAALPAMQEQRRFYYENRIFRFRVLLWVSLLLVATTVSCFVLDQFNETTWKFEEHSFNDYIIVSSSLHFGMFGMWSGYVFAITVLYSPSASLQQNQTSVQYQAAGNLLSTDLQSNDDDEVQFQHPKTF